MKNIILIPVLLLLLLNQLHAIEPVYSEILAKDSVSWDGKEFAYPTGVPEITIKKITIDPGGKELVLSEHCHTFPLAAYVLSGSVHVEEPSGRYHIFRAGNAFIEVMNSWHKGKFTEPTELIAFYAGSVDTPLSIKKDSDAGHTSGCK
ncbi:MAG: cupin domain-containing protein [Pseudomonadota bacterium]